MHNGAAKNSRKDNKRGAITESILDLNRSDLVVRRNERLQSVNKLLRSWEQTNDKAMKDVLTEELKRECTPDKEYSAFVKSFLIAKGFPEDKLQ